MAREIEVAVLEGIDGAPPDTSLPGELRLDGGEEFYDFEAKYLDQASGMLIPAPIPTRTRTDPRDGRCGVQRCPPKAWPEWTSSTPPDGQILVNEINTFPGMSPTSYFQKMWEATGLSFPELIDRLLQTALARRPGLR